MWFPPRKIPLEDGTAKLLPVLVMTATYSRLMLGRMIPTRKTEVAGFVGAIQQLGRVPRRLIWDNEPGIGRGQRRAEDVASFMGTLAAKLVLLPPRDPEAKGLVERREKSPNQACGTDRQDVLECRRGVPQRNTGRWEWRPGKGLTHRCSANGPGEWVCTDQPRPGR